MNARHMTTVLGALALGIATIGVVPAIAQTGGAGTNGVAPGSAAGGITNPAGGQSDAPGMMTGRPGGTSGRGMSGNKMSEGGMSGRGTSPGAMSPRAMGGKQGSPMHSGSYRTTARHGGRHAMMGAGSAQAQNPEVDRLNERSLMAARKHEAFSPSSQQ